MTQHQPQQRGITLIEALIALLVLTLGMLGTARMQSHWRGHANVAQQRSQAVRLAQEDLETLRAYSTMAAASGVRSWDDVASHAQAVDHIAGHATTTRYEVDRQVQAAGAAKQASVTVRWADAAGGQQRVVLHTVMAGSDPVYSGALGIEREATQAQGAWARSARIPAGAKSLSPGQSAFKPVSQGDVAYVFDNHSGAITQRCTGLAATTRTATLNAADLTHCQAQSGLWLSGVVRFHDNAPLPLSMNVVLSHGPYAEAPVCYSELIQADGAPYVAYACVVPLRADGRWSGRSVVVPHAWALGNGSTDRRVCRYTADLNLSGQIDANIEHPADYANVDTALANQNFVVIPGTQACASAAAVRISGRAGDVFADLSTAPHQP